MGPILGALAAAAFKGIFDIGSTIFQNKYNAPKAQLKRLRDAGLPLSYMYQGNVNEQSEAPKLSIDPDLGVTEQKNLANTTRLTDEQIEKLKAEIKNLGYEGTSKFVQSELDKGKLNWNNEVDLVERGKGINQYRTKQEQALDIDLATKKADQFIAQHTSRIKGVLADIEVALKKTTIEQRKEELNKVKQAITNLVSQDKLLNQLYDVREIDQTVNNVISKMLEETGDGGTMFYALLVKLFSKL